MTNTNTKNQKRLRLTNEQKALICDMQLMNSKMTQLELGKWAQNKFNLEEPLSQKTVSNILSNRDKIYERMREGDAQKRTSNKMQKFDLDEEIEEFITQMNKNNAPISRGTVTLFARTVAEKKYKMSQLPKEERITFSDGWLTKVFKRIGVKSRHMYGEESSVDLASENIVEQLKKIEQILVDGGFKREDILNFDETGLYYEQQPTRTICKSPIGGTKKSKNRFTVGLLTNADGNYKGHPIVIGRRKTPRGANTNRRLYSKTGLGNATYVEYHYNASAWMTADIFYSYIRRVNASFAYADRKVAILVDNASVHKIKEKLSHITLIFLPANTTSKLQPLDAGKKF